MKKLIAALSGASLLAIAPISSSLAQTNTAPDTNSPAVQPAPDTTAPANQQTRPADQRTQRDMRADRQGPADNQISDEVDARVARLKAELRLTPDQEKNWAGMQSALHDYGLSQFRTMQTGRSVRQDPRSNADQNARPDYLDMMRREADELSARADALKKLANAAGPLYGSLDDQQRRKAIRFMAGEFNRRM